MKRKFLVGCVFVLLVGGVGLALFSFRPIPSSVAYGTSFSRLHSDELGLDWKETFDAIVDDLGVRRFRLSAHWPRTEPVNNQFNFEELDYQIKRAEEVGARVVLGVGRRLPRWPECHVPSWAEGLSWEEQKEEIRGYIREVVGRYKDRDVIEYWQVENEPFLEVFAHEHCGDLDTMFLEEEIELVRSLDPDTPILMTDSGNLGTWLEPYRLGDAFGTSLYRYFWTPDLGMFTSRLPAAFYRFKHNLARLVHGSQPTMIIELSAEPWLVEPIVETPIEMQLERMNVDRLKETVAFAKTTGFGVQYLWGVEWWYWMKQQGYPELWEYAGTLY